MSATILFASFSLSADAPLIRIDEEEAAPEPRTCPYCKQEIANDATRCPRCTAKLEGYANAQE